MLNQTPVFPGAPMPGTWVNVGTSANTAKDGTGTVATVVTAPTDGAIVRRLRIKSTGTTGALAVLRVFVNNGSSNATPGNNTLITEVALPNITNSESAPQVDLIVSLDELPLAGGHKVNLTCSQAVTNGWQVTAEAFSLAQV